MVGTGTGIRETVRIYIATYIYTFHGCTKLLNLGMEPKCLTKSDVQLIPDISRTKNDKRIL